MSSVGLHEKTASVSAISKILIEFFSLYFEIIFFELMLIHFRDIFANFSTEVPIPVPTLKIPETFFSKHFNIISVTSFI